MVYVLRLTPASIARMKRAHDKLLTDTSEAIADALNEGGVKALAVVDSKTVFTPRTGALQEATKTRVVKLANGRVLKISNRKKYANAIDKGSKPHLIAARRKPYLVFFWAKVGHWVKTKSVWHPGTKPYRTFENAATQAGHRTEQVLRGRMTQIARRF